MENPTQLFDGVPSANLQSRVGELEASVKNLEARLAGYQRIYLDNPVPTLIFNCENCNILDVSDSFTELYGYSREHLLGTSLVSLFEPLNKLRLDELQKDLRKPINTLGPFRHRTASGGFISVKMICLPFEWKGFDSRIILIQDETAQHSAEEALRASEERFRELFENANDVIFLHDLNGKVLAINRAAESLTGYSRTEVVGRNFEDFIAPDARNQTQDNIRTHLGGSATQHYELPILSKLGTRRFLEVSTRILYRRGHPIAIQGIGRDITDRKLAQHRLLETAEELRSKNEELSQALARANEATQLKEQFLANTSHELRTPLNGIMGMINLLKATPLQPDQLEYADIVGQCANDLLTIINDLLDLSQIEAGRIGLIEEEFDLSESVNAVVRLLRIRADQKGLTIKCSFDPQLPTHVYGDSLRFRQILTNLIGNAVKFTSSGGIDVNLSGSGREGLFRCEVVYTGIGDNESVKEKIFEAFVQADGTTRRRFGGTGLGLTISRQLANIMGGTMGMYNNASGEGTTFWFELPLRASVGLPNTTLPSA
jgi:PAS domain S-box-containing protein